MGRASKDGREHDAATALASAWANIALVSRTAAVMGLARMGKPVDQTPLSTMLLSDSSPRVRAHAAFCLGEIGNRSALGLLRQAARSSVPRASDTEIKLMQLQVSEALVKLGDDENVQSIRAALYPSRPEELEATALAVQILGQVRDKGSSGAMIHLGWGTASPTNSPHAIQLIDMTPAPLMGYGAGPLLGYGLMAGLAATAVAVDDNLSSR